MFKTPQGTFNNLNPVVANTKSGGKKKNDVDNAWCVTQNKYFIFIDCSTNNRQFCN